MKCPDTVTVSGGRRTVERSFRLRATCLKHAPARLRRGSFLSTLGLSNYIVSIAHPGKVPNSLCAAAALALAFNRETYVIDLPEHITQTIPTPPLYTQTLA